jgi:glutaredoxin
MSMVAIGVIALILLAYFFGNKSSGYYSEGDGPIGGGDKGNIIVYGSKTCPWCVKQEKYFMDKGIDYTFVNCHTETCPEFVSGFPTLMVNSEVKVGYTEL